MIPIQGGDPEHVEFIQGIERRDVLPSLRSYTNIAETVRKLGFAIVKEWDLAKPPTQLWWQNHIVVTILAALGIAPKGTVNVYEMHFKTADYLTRRGDFGIFSPMYMILYKKPHDKDEQIECFIGKLEN
ncbi:hypothetical protein JHK85_000958 [Glycine max]|nr:hypothetical protein JHK85_000958 [Glycine max]KAG5088313.1 hypothetical protein JHK86_000925 [Glycine max]